MKRLLICLAVAAMMFACKEPVPEQIVPEGKLPIKLSLSTTRANDTAYEVGDQVGLYVANYANGAATQLTNSGNHVDNMQFTLSDNGAWMPATNIYWKDKSTRADFYAYYPYQSAVSDVTAVPVSVMADQSSEENYWASDLLWGKSSGVTPTESAVNIATSHMLSNLLIYVEPGYGFTNETLAAANVSVEINNVKRGGTLNLTDGVVTATGEAGSVTPWNTGDYYRALIVPQSVAEGSTLITVTVNGKAHTIERGFTFVANTQHTFVVRVEQDVETTVSLSINPWNQDPNIYGIPDNEIWYTSTDGNIVEPKKLYEGGAYGFKANITSNTYINGKGVIVFDEPITSIGIYTFNQCENLESITIPKGVHLNGHLIFSGCSNLTKFESEFASADKRCLIEEGVLKEFAPAGLEEYTIPEDVTIIGYCAFADKSDLVNINISEGVTTIEEYAFAECEKLQSIKLPSSVVSVEACAFYSCFSLNSVYCKSTTPAETTLSANGWDAFSYCDDNLKIYVPASDDDSIINAYKAAEGWSEYADLIEEYEFE